MKPTTRVSTQENQIPLLDRLPKKKKLKMQKGKDDHKVTFATNVTNGNKKRSSTCKRSDSVNERYGKVGEENNIKQYNEELLQVVEDGVYDKCEQLLVKGVSVDVKDEETGSTALHIASKNNSYDILRLLLEKGANCNAQDKNEQVPLHVAVLKDHRECCQLLLNSQSLHINIHNKTHDTPLHYAAKEGRVDVCQLLLGHKDVKINAKNKKGMNPLHYAAQENHDTILKLLLDNGADWRQQDNHSYLPLHYAAQKGYHKCCEILMAHVNDDERQKQLITCIKDGKTPLMLAAQRGHHNCCEVMRYGNITAKDKEGNTALHYAALRGYDNTVTELLNAGANPNTENKKGISPVLEAVGKNKFGCLKILAEKGARLTVSDKQKKTALHYAAEKNALEALRFLLSYPDLIKVIDVLDINMYTPLHLAIKKEADDCAVLLLENGASPTLQCTGGMTPLHLAADKESTNVCAVLLSKKEVQVSQENDLKATPLHLAAVRGSVDVCQMLIRKGARITAVDLNGRTALHVASAEGHSKVVKFLSKKGIPLRSRDDKGSMALHLAASKGSLDCCKILVDCAKATCWEVEQNGDLPLDKAFKKREDCLNQESLSQHDQVFKFLLEHLCFKEKHEDRCLRIHDYMHVALQEKRVTIVGAIVSSCWWNAGFKGKNGYQCPNFRTLIKDYPQIALKLQEKCISRDDRSSSQAAYDFSLFEDNYYIPPASDCLAKSPFDAKTNKLMPSAAEFTGDGLSWKRNHPLTLMISHQRHQLLQHPLTKAWLLQKWRSYMFIIFLCLLLVEILFSLFLASFMGIENNWLHVKNNYNLTQKQFTNITESLTQRNSYKNLTGNITYENGTISENDRYHSIDYDGVISQITEGSMNFKRISGLWIVLLVLTTLTLLLEINFVWRLKKEYFKQADHILQLLKIIFTSILLFPEINNEFRYMILDVWQWECGIIALLLTWLHLINTLNQLPMLSVFMPLTGSFVKSFFKVVFFICMIVFLFAFIFHLLLRDQDAFSTVPQAMVKTIVWMLGDLAYDDTFLVDGKQLYYPVMVNLFFVMFVTVLGGFIANLVLTQPADILDLFRDKASFHRDASRAMLFLKLDVCFLSFRKRWAVGSYVDDESGRNYGYFMKKLLKFDSKEEIQPTNDPNNIQIQLEELNSQFAKILALHSEHREEVRELKYQVNFLTKTLLEQKQP